jgi:hypothetical protein
MILSWLQRRRLEQTGHNISSRRGPEADPDPDADSTSSARHADHGEDERPADGIDAGVRTL